MVAKKLKLNDSTVSYLDSGNGKVVVLLHGFCGSSRYWEKVIPVLSENYRIIALDLPGHGESSILEGNYTIEDIADHIKHFLDEMKVEQVSMFGHSLGGYITLAFAEKYSKLLEGFALVHSTAFPDSEEAKQGRIKNVEKVKQEGIRTLIDGLVPKLFSPDNLVRNSEDIAVTKEIGYSTLPQGAISTLIAMKDRPDLNSVLEWTELPVLLIAGEKDQIIPPEKTFTINKGNIRHSLIKDTGHMSMYEQPKGLISEINEFMSKLNGN